MRAPIPAGSPDSRLLLLTAGLDMPVPPCTPPVRELSVFRLTGSGTSDAPLIPHRRTEFVDAGLRVAAGQRRASDSAGT
jgi:hypothetical protein